jgi:predicted Fe-S protein YdhL (DUF1289 family)
MVDDARLRPQSPCINVCVLDGDGLCAGCLRDLTEIASWGAMTSAEQWHLIAALKERRKLRVPQHEPGPAAPAVPR